MQNLDMIIVDTQRLPAQTLELHIEVLDRKIELLVASAGSCCCCCCLLDTGTTEDASPRG
jgi:hypothetical protein